MNKTLALILALVMCLCLFAACGSNDQPAADTNKPADNKPADNKPADNQPAEAEYPETTMTFSHFGPETTGSGEGIERFKELLAEKSGGKVVLETYHNGTMYDQTNEFEALMKGSCDFIVTSMNNTMNYIPEFKTTFCPYLWVSIEHWRDFWETDIGSALMDRQINELGVRHVCFFEAGYRHVILNEDIKVMSRESLNGIKVRAATTENMITMVEALGGNAVPIPFADVYLGMETGVVNGLECDLFGAINNGLAEVAKAATLNKHYLSFDGFAVCEKSFQSWAPEVQELVLECAAIVADEICAKAAQNEIEAEATLKDLGCKIYNLTNEEYAAYRQEVMDAFIGSEFASTYDMELFQAIAEMGNNYTPR